MKISENCQTVKLYDFDAYASSFEARVIACEAEDGLYSVKLDKTLFFPEEGGQSCDKGTIDGKPVKKVLVQADNIAHYVDEPLQLGSLVKGEIDFKFRYRNMQNHSGEHIVSGLIHKLYRINNVGFHLGSEDVTMDYDAELTQDMLDEIEDEANRAVYANVDIIAKYYDMQELKNLDYRSKLDFKDAKDVRIVTVSGYDICACCAPHVRRTGEIGIIKFVDAYRYKGGTRVHMHCGYDALLDYRKKHYVVTELSALFSAKTDGILTAAERLSEENRRLTAEITSATKRLCEKIAQGLHESSDGICVFEDSISSGGMRIIANAGASKALFCAVFCKKREGGCGYRGYNYIITSEKISAKCVLETLKDNFGSNIKGGGTDTMVQGSIAADAKSEDIERILKHIKII